MALTAAPALAATLAGREAVLTTEPGLQSHAANHGGAHGPQSSIATEARHLPDGPNQPSVPAVGLRPGETFAGTTTFRFGAEG